MRFNLIKSIVFICLLAMLNACGIGRYHSLNLVRPDKNTSATLVKPKHKTNKVKIEYNSDSAITQVTKENILTKSANTVSEKTEISTIPFLKKSLKNTTKVKIGLKKKGVFNLVENKIPFSKNNKNIKHYKEQNKWKPNYDYDPFAFDFEIFLIILLLSFFIIGLLTLPFNVVVGLWIIGVVLAIIFLIAVIKRLSSTI